MRRALKPLAYGLLIVLAMLLYREWVERNRLPLFLPLGFSTSPDETIISDIDATDPNNWLDPVQSIVVEASIFDTYATDAEATTQSADILVIGATMGGLSAALAGAEDGATVLLATPRDWMEEIRTYAGEYAAETHLPFAQSEIERILRHSLSGSVQTPSTIGSFFEDRVQDQERLEILSSYSLILFSKNTNGRIDRALLQSSNGSNAIVVRFSMLIDGTREGSTLAKAGIDTVSGWDAREDTGDPASLPADAIKALHEGLTLSGHTIPGIGKRLGGLRMHMGVVDHGYGGRFIAPNQASDCWIKDPKNDTALISGQPIMRATKTDCVATFDVSTSFQDSMELFFINHGNDGLSITIERDNSPPLHIVTHVDRAERFIRIGAFPVSRDSPLRITVHSLLPTDRLEGFIARKLNTGSAGITLTMNDDRPTSFMTDTWAATTHDIYVHAATETDTVRMQIDDRLHDAHRIGEDTFRLQEFVLTPGEHLIQIPDGHDRYDITVIPVAPQIGSNPFTNEKNDQPAGWIDSDQHTAILHAAHAREARIIPPANGMYDVWIRSNRSRAAVLTIGNNTEHRPISTAWTSIGTRLLTKEGLTVTTGGNIEVIALPNTMRDTFTVQVSEKEPATLLDLPSGRYRLVSDGPSNPRIIRLHHDDDSVQEMVFDPSDDPYTSRDILLHDGSSLTIELSQPWPQNVTFHEFTDTADPLPPSTISGALTHVSRNLLLFEPFRHGVGPVTIGTLESSALQQHLRTLLEDAYVLLRYGGSYGDLCSEKTDVTCDTRRFERTSTIFGTNDALGSFAITTDGRRLVGKDTLRTDGTDTESGGIITVSGVSVLPNILSPDEQSRDTFKRVMSSLRTKKNISARPTYLETPLPTRDISLTLGMFLPKNGNDNILAVSALSATHAAQQSLRGTAIELAIGGAIGHIASYALLQERLPLETINLSPNAMERLKYFLIERGTTVVPMPQPTDDPLLQKAMQRRIIRNQWPPASLTSATTFGKNNVSTVGDALRSLPGAPQGNDKEEIIRFGMENGFLTDIMLQMDEDELLLLPLHEKFLLKAEYLLQTNPH